MNATQKKPFSQLTDISGLRVRQVRAAQDPPPRARLLQRPPSRPLKVVREDAAADRAVNHRTQQIGRARERHHLDGRAARPRQQRAVGGARGRLASGVVVGLGAVTSMNRSSFGWRVSNSYRRLVECFRQVRHSRRTSPSSAGLTRSTRLRARAAVAALGSTARAIVH